MVWNSYPANQLNSREIIGKLRALADQPGTRTLSNDGDVKDAFAKADHVIERYFETPFLAHLPMAPMNAVANVHDGKIEVWAGLATPMAPFADIILEMGLIEHPDDLVIHQPYVGGQFGRANDWDHVLYAVYGSQQAGAPVKVIYDRVTDTARDSVLPRSVESRSRSAWTRPACPSRGRSTWSARTWRTSRSSRPFSERLSARRAASPTTHSRSGRSSTRSRIRLPRSRCSTETPM